MSEILQTEVVTIALILLSVVALACSSAAETAVTGLSTLKTKHLINQSTKRHKGLELWLAQPGRVLTALLAFNTLITIFVSALVTEASSRIFNDHSLGIATGFTTLVILIFCEIFPKSLGKTYSEKIALPALNVIRVVYLVFFPIIYALAFFSDKLLVTLSGKDFERPLITEEELEFLVDEGERAGVFEETKKDLISSVFDFDEKKVRDVMTHRVDMVAVDYETNLEEAIKVAAESGHSRIPVYQNSRDEIIGILLAKDLLRHFNMENKNRSIMTIVRKPFRVPESKPIIEVFKSLQKSKMHLAVVMDEYGGTAGVVTLEDIIEELVGEIQDEHDVEEADSVERAPGVFEISGWMNVHEFLDQFNLDLGKIEDAEDHQSDTVVGLLTHILGEIPKIGQKIVLGDLEIEVLKVTNHRVESLLVKTPISKLEAL